MVPPLFPAFPAKVCPTAKWSSLKKGRWGEVGVSAISPFLCHLFVSEYWPMFSLSFTHTLTHSLTHSGPAASDVRHANKAATGSSVGTNTNHARSLPPFAFVLSFNEVTVSARGDFKTASARLFPLLSLLSSISLYQPISSGPHFLCILQNCVIHQNDNFI